VSNKSGVGEYDERSGGEREARRRTEDGKEKSKEKRKGKESIV
jgi:hypothetical protein